MELIVTEKPKVANKIAYILGEGRIIRKSYNRVSYYEIEKDGKKIIIAPAVGHLFSLTEKNKSYEYPIFDIEWVPNYKISKSADYTKNYLLLLESLSQEADEFTSACDYDIEGSLIGGNVFFQVYKKGNGKRMKFSSLTPIDIKSAYENKEELDYGNINAGEARHILDWYYGINLSRALMSALKQAKGFRIMSIGRVQGPALNILAELERSIKNFIPTPYWEVYIVVKGIKFMHEEERFTDEDKAKKAFDNTREKALVDKKEVKEHEMWPLPPYDLTSLQIDAYRLFKFSPSRTLEIAQSLYENSLISYPRTSSQKLPFKLGLTKIIEKLSKNESYKKETEKIIQNKWFKPVEGRKDDPAHPAIHPTGVDEKKTKEEEKLYDLIVRRFLACFAPKAKKELVSVVLDSNGEKYNASGSRMIEKGWIEFYEKYYSGKDNILPEFNKGEEEKVEDKRRARKETTPPRRYTAASIISELEKRSLGTKATRATILDRLYERNYIAGSSIEVTEFGLAVDEILKKYAPDILDEELTIRIEQEMELIQDSKKKKEEVVEEGKKILEKVLKNWKKNEGAIGNELSEALKTTENEQNMVGDCDKCDGKLKIINLKFGKKFIGCTNYPECKNAYPLPTGAFVKPTDKKCNKCGKPMVFLIKGRKRYSFCIDINCPSKKEWRSKNEKNK
ncbi:MAG: DNA topoisomerase I [Candidatus ainarchaeum sp.]|nr:DNA topoisomerase I [Candidatus ainarchaeum sp.]